MNTKSKSIILFINCLATINLVTAQDSVMLKMPDTGQSKSYSAIWGEDADYTINPPSYNDNKNGTITDNVSKLVWQKTDGGEMTWEIAKDYCSNLNLAGYSWRLPNSYELFGILNHQQNPAIDTNVFKLTAARYWWTSQVCLDDASKIWVVNSGGGIGPHLKTETLSAGGSRTIHTRCVKNVSWNQSYTNNEKGTVTDSKTGLMWQKEPVTTTKNWFEALNYAENLEFAGYTDWRLPNIKELQSISEVMFSNPSVNPAYFASINSSLYWSSTTLVSKDTTQAWNIDFTYGLISYGLKTDKHYILCVRNSNSKTALSTISQDELEIKISPNPVIKISNSVSISFSKSMASPFKIEIFNQSGILFSSAKCDNFYETKTYQLATDKLHTGIYFIKLSTNNSVFIAKLLVL